MAKKLYYKIGEACKRLDIQPYVLRYWETEFPLLAPNKSTSGQRVYSDQDLRVIQRIKELLYEEGYTIAGAKKKLEKQDLSALAELRDKPAATRAGEGLAPRNEAEESDEAPAQSPPTGASPTSEAAPAAESKRSSKGKSRAKARKSSAAAVSSAAEAKLRRGIREALKEARGILDLLDS